MSNGKCQFIKDDETQCQGFAMNGTNYCFTHNPACSEAKREAVIKGGNSRRQKLEPVQISSVHDLPKLIANTINDVRVGDLSSKDGNTIAKLAFAYLQTTGFK